MTKIKKIFDVDIVIDFLYLISIICVGFVKYFCLKNQYV